MTSQLDRMEGKLDRVLVWSEGDPLDPKKPGAEDRIQANTRFRKNATSVILWAAKIIGAIMLSATVVWALTEAF